jgi:uncharacterized protein (DUF305 family)
MARLIKPSLALALTLAALGAQAHDAAHHLAATEQAAPSPEAASHAQSFTSMMGDAMTAMDEGMQLAPMNGDPDHDFAAMMIPHHRGAIDMAKAQLLYGKNPRLRRLAQEIIVTQDSEITVMQAELN